MEVMKMKEFYSFTKEDLPDFVRFLKKQEDIATEDIPEGKEKLLFFYGLVIDLLENAGRSRKLKNTFKCTYKDKGKVVGGFIEILKEWIEENNGKGNLLEVIKVLRSNGYLNLAEFVEHFLFRYSLPISSGNRGSDEVNVYSQSRDFLRVKKNEDASLGSVPIWNANPVEQALQNSVILEEVFRKLNVTDQKVFRLVTPTWMKETISFWRRSSLLQLHVSGNPDDEKINGISMTLFVNLVDLEESARQRRRRTSKTNHQLLEYPFHRYQLSYKRNEGYGKEIPFSCGQKEVKFWELCGPHIEDLEVDNAYFDGWSAAENTVEKFCEKIFLDICPKMKKFKIGSMCRVEYPRLMNAQPGSVAMENANEKKVEKVASNLHTLAVEVYIREDIFKKILCLCPKIKTLILRTHRGWENSRALLPSTSNGECLKLETLIIEYHEYSHPDVFLPLRKYSEILSKKGFNCLQHLTLEVLNLNDARRPPFDLYAALANFSRSLKTLELKLKAGDGIGDRKWFAELSPFAFPNLTALKLSFHVAPLLFPRVMYFDFGALKGMPKLERFELRMKNKNAKRFGRNPGTQDWVFNGDRNGYLPEGVSVDYTYSEEKPILCNRLKEFTFIGCWTLNEEDIKLVSAWFPNLTYLEAAVELEVVSSLRESLTRLEKIDLKTEKMVSLGNLRRLGEKQKGLRICQTFSGGSFLQSVEMKEHNGRLYFANRNSEKF